MKFVVDKQWLKDKLNEPNVQIVDCRFSLVDPSKGSQEYAKSHIPGAIFFDLEKDLSGKVSEHGGRHPLPEIAEFIEKLEKAGIDENTTVISYDHGEGAFAARFWWMLQYLGHEKVYVLDGGFKAWVEADYLVTNEFPIIEPTKFKINVKHEMIADVQAVREIVSGMRDTTVLIDSREEKRYLGLEEPIDKKAGRIPGAINKPWFEGLVDGQYKRAELQKQRFSEIAQDQEIIVYCGSGVTAVPNYLALKEAGFDKVKLYLGSFSDWISYSENEID